MSQLFIKADLDYAQIATKLSTILGRKWNVNIVFGGHPSTAGRTIYLPHWNFKDWSAPLEWSSLKVSASWAFGLLARCFLVLVGDIPKSYAGAPCCNAGASVRSGSGLL